MIQTEVTGLDDYVEDIENKVQRLEKCFKKVGKYLISADSEFSDLQGMVEKVIRQEKIMSNLEDLRRVMT